MKPCLTGFRGRRFYNCRRVPLSRPASLYAEGVFYRNFSEQCPPKTYRINSCVVGAKKAYIRATTDATRRKRVRWLVIQTAGSPRCRDGVWPVRNFRPEPGRQSLRRRSRPSSPSCRSAFIAVIRGQVVKGLYIVSVRSPSVGVRASINRVVKLWSDA